MPTRPIVEKFTALLLAGTATATLMLLMHVGSMPARPLMQLERVVIIGKSSPKTAMQQAAEPVPAALLARRSCEQPQVC